VVLELVMLVLLVLLVVWHSLPQVVVHLYELTLHLMTVTLVLLEPMVQLRVVLLVRVVSQNSYQMQRTLSLVI
jgi:hypothetical protein